MADDSHNVQHERREDAEGYKDPEGRLLGIWDRINNSGNNRGFEQRGGGDCAPRRCETESYCGGRPSVCFTCGERGHMKAWCTQRKPQTEQEERQESVDQVGQDKATEKETEEETEKEAEKGFIMVKRKSGRSGGMSSPPDKQKKKRDEVRKGTVKEGRKKEKESKKKVELPVEKVSETQLYEGKMERLFMEEKKRELKVQEKGKKIQGGKGVWYYVMYPKNVETEKKMIKLHSIVKVKVPPYVYAEDIKAKVIEEENYRKLKEMYGDNVDPPGVEVEFKELPPVVELREIEPLMKFY
uniref:CCHC-type domain-containing protein n=1 Tax=Octopus bimaculoides TaxID=37653 RepID=A0A0L8G1L3_OCTBM